MRRINFNNYHGILRYIIKFLNKHANLKYCRPLGETKRLVAKGLTSQLLKRECLDTIKNSKEIKYMHYTLMHWDNDQDYLVYVYLVMDTFPVMYAKFAVHDKTYTVFFLGWHPSTRPHDKRFSWLIRR